MKNNVEATNLADQLLFELVKAGLAPNVATLNGEVAAERMTKYLTKLYPELIKMFESQGD